MKYSIHGKRRAKQRVGQLPDLLQVWRKGIHYRDVKNHELRQYLSIRGTRKTDLVIYGEQVFVFAITRRMLITVYRIPEELRDIALQEQRGRRVNGNVDGTACILRRMARKKNSEYAALACLVLYGSEASTEALKKRRDYLFRKITNNWYGEGEEFL